MDQNPPVFSEKSFKPSGLHSTMDSSFVVLVILAGLLSACSASGSGLTAVLGDHVSLGGDAPGADSIFLFLTGPNLPSNGVRLDDLSTPVVTGDPSSFTRAAVTEDRWSYTWNTRTRGQLPDTGVYTIFVSTTPRGRNDLQSGDYATIAVTLTLPSLAVPPVGSLSVRTVPPGAELRIDGTLQGTTPLDLTGVPEGNHSVEISMPGYQVWHGNASIMAGKTTLLEPVLSPVSTLRTTTLPSTTPVEPISMPFPWTGVAGALCIAALLIHIRAGGFPGIP